MGGFDQTRPVARAIGVGRSARLQLLAQVRELTRRQRLLLDRLSRAEEIADGLVQDLMQVEAALEGASTANLQFQTKAAETNGGTGAAIGVLRRTADSGAFSIELKQRTDGSTDVRVDGGKVFNLPPILADLLAILVTDSGTSTDEFVGWKSLDEVAILLGKRVGRPVRRHAATQHVYRLRRELFARGGLNPFLVQTNRRRGARFALRRKSMPVIGDDRV